MSLGWRLADFVTALFEFIIKIVYYTFRYILPWLVMFIGLPLFLGGCLIAGGFSLALLILLTGGIGFYLKFVKKTALTPPLDLSTGKIRQKVQQMY